MQSLRLRSQFVTVLFLALALACLAGAWSASSVAEFLTGVAPGSRADETAARALDARQNLILLIEGGLWIACGIAFLMWFFRAYDNLHEAQYESLEFTSGWAIGSFFVPFLNLVRPFKIMLEVCNGSAYLGEAEEDRVSKATSLRLHAGIWWAAFLITAALTRLSGLSAIQARAIDELIAAERFASISQVCLIPASIIALLLVRRVTKCQERAFVKWSSGN